MFAVWSRTGGSIVEMQTEWSTMDLVLAVASLEIHYLIQAIPAPKES